MMDANDQSALGQGTSVLVTFPEARVMPVQGPMDAVAAK